MQVRIAELAAQPDRLPAIETNNSERLNRPMTEDRFSRLNDLSFKEKTKPKFLTPIRKQYNTESENL